MRVVFISSLLMSYIFALHLNSIQCNNAKFIYNKTANKQYAKFLIALAYKESSLYANKIHKCDLRLDNKCYDSLNLFQTNIHTAMLFYPKNSYEIIYDRLKTSRLFALNLTNKIFKSNTKMITKSYHNDIVLNDNGYDDDTRMMSKQYLLKMLQIYNSGRLNETEAYKYDNEVYKIYKNLKGKICEK